MIFDVYYPFYSQKKQGLVPGIKPVPMEYSRIKNEVLSSQTVRIAIEKHRAGEPDQKITLPSICFVGHCTSTRKNAAMIPTQFVMIDIDHVKDPNQAWEAFKTLMTWDWICDNVLLAHLTPSRGIHIYFRAQEGLTTLQENMNWLNDQVNFGQWGDYDSVVHDFARISFAFLADEILFENTWLIMNVEPEFPEILVNPAYNPGKEQGAGGKEQGAGGKEQGAGGKEQGAGGKEQGAGGKEQGAGGKESDVPTYADEEKAKLDKEVYKNTPLKEIIDAWIDYRGEPGANEIHNYYNEMVKFFRNIMGNNKRKIFYLLPKFGHSDEECWSQVKSICKSNTLSRLDREFYFFLLDRGYITAKKDQRDTEYMLSESKDEDWGDMPTPPPVFREFIQIAPKDFRIPTVNALLPILGTLSSYVCARYPYDDRMHTTSFFSVIYGPPSSGKGFVDRTDFLFDDLRIRDLVQSSREAIYLRVLNKKGDNERSPDDPHTSLRIIPAKNSESEFLSKQRDNQGYHMFTYAPEMDSWAKGEKAAGGNKNDMIRIAWDNGFYGQQFKSASTFKGTVRLYWNVLITGTLNQVEKYFQNVENGLASRCSFCGIENQEYQPPQKWKPITQKGMQIIRNYMKRCDENSYEKPCTYEEGEILACNDDDFLKDIDWRFKFKPRQEVDMSWIMPTIDEFEEQECKKASLALDPARDSFRRRVGVRGFRLALLCTTLYPQMNSRSQNTIINFVKWWMKVDLENILRLLGERYNEQTNKVVGFSNQDVFASLPDEFSKNDVMTAMRRQNKRSKVADVVWRWKKLGAIEEIDKYIYKKKKK